MRRNGYLGASGQKLTTPFAPATSIFYRTISTIGWPFSAYIWCFCAQFLFGASCLVLQHYLRPFYLDGVWRIKSLIRPTHLPILSSLRLSVSELCVSQSDHITITWNGHCACAVSRDLCIGGPPKPHVTIFWPRLIYSLYNFYGATMTFKGSFILEHPHVKAIFGRKKNQV